MSNYTTEFTTSYENTNYSSFNAGCVDIQTSSTESTLTSEDLDDYDLTLMDDKLLDYVFVSAVREMGMRALVEQVVNELTVDVLRLKEKILKHVVWNKRVMREHNVHFEKQLLQQEISSKLSYEEYQMYHWVEKIDGEYTDQDLTAMNDNFTETANMIAKILIFEKNLPVYMKSIKPANTGGVAGGEKFIAHGILFKYAVDTEVSNGYWIYGKSKRNDYLASKALNNDISSLKALYQCKKDLNLPIILPFICIINYLGITIAAVSLLPLEKNSLVYGTGDAGKTIYDSKNDSVLNEIVSKIADYFGFSEHGVVDDRGEIHHLKFAADVEIHLSNGRYYMLDFGRFLPPNDPLSPFVNQFRPEYLIANDFKISCDAFSGFGKHESSIHNSQAMTQIENFLKYIGGTLITEFSNELANSSLDIFFHRKGINLRYLGYIRNQLQFHELGRIQNDIHSNILGEMTSRSLNTLLKSLLAKKVSDNIEPVEYSFKKIIVDFTRKIYDASDREIWYSLDSTYSVKKMIMKKYQDFALTSEEKNESYNILKSIFFDKRATLDEELESYLDLYWEEYAGFTGGSMEDSTQIELRSKSVFDNKLLQIKVDQLYQNKENILISDIEDCIEIFYQKDLLAFKLLEVVAYFYYHICDEPQIDHIIASIRDAVEENSSFYAKSLEIKDDEVMNLLIHTEILDFLIEPAIKFLCTRKRKYSDVAYLFERYLTGSITMFDDDYESEEDDNISEYQRLVYVISVIYAQLERKTETELQKLIDALKEFYPTDHKKRNFDFNGSLDFSHMPKAIDKYFIESLEPLFDEPVSLQIKSLNFSKCRNIKKFLKKLHAFTNLETLNLSKTGIKKSDTTTLQKHTGSGLSIQF